VVCACDPGESAASRDRRLIGVRRVFKPFRKAVRWIKLVGGEENANRRMWGDHPAVLIVGGHPARVGGDTDAEGVIPWDKTRLPIQVVRPGLS
jgi:hypothetical protein